MFDAASLSDPPAPERMPDSIVTDGRPSSTVAYDGRLHLRVDKRQGATRVADLYQSAPCRAMFPGAGTSDPLDAVLINIAGGLVGGDRIETAITAEPQAALFVTTQAAEKVYRSAADPVRLETRLSVKAGACLEWMPQPTILFNGARLHRALSIEVSGDGVFLGGEMLVLGRTAHGEVLTAGTLRDRWDVSIDGHLVWREQTGVDDWADALAAPARWNGAQAVATLIFAEAYAADHLDAVRDALPATVGVRYGATALPGLLLLRWMGPDAADVLQHWRRAWSVLRARHLGAGSNTAGPMPALWTS